MADNLLSLTDALLINDVKNDIAVDEIINRAPFVTMLPTVVTKDGSAVYQYLKYTADPSAVFRAVNEGKDYSSTEQQTVTIALKHLDANVRMDIAAAKIGGNPDAAIFNQASRALKNYVFEMEKQIINGTKNNANGFEGFADQLDSLSNDMVVDGGGSGSNEFSSVYLVKVGPGSVYNVVTGPVEGLGEIYKTDVVAANGKSFSAIAMNCNGWAATVIATSFDAARICNLTTTNGLSDDLIAQALKTFPNGKPTHILANREQLYQLRKSRATDLNVSPEWPTDSMGIPIVEVESITNTEAEVV